MQVGLLVEDHKEARVWLSEVLDAAFPGIRVVTADCVGAARTLLQNLRKTGIPIDVALVDLTLPDGSGINVIRDLRKNNPECISVVSTRHDDDDYLFSALRAGAQGYLLKQQPQADLTRLLKRLAMGEPPLSPVIAHRLLANFFNPDTATSDPVPALTPREREVLSLLAKGCTLADVGSMLEITRNTVAAHVKRIYAKLHVSNRAEATMEGIRQGFINP